MQDAGEFTSDIAAANDQDRLGQLFQMEDVVRHHAQIGVLGFGTHRTATNRNQNMFGCFDFTGRQLHRVRILNGRAGVKRFHVRTCQQLAIDAFKAVQFFVQLAGKLGPVEITTGDFPAVATCIGADIGIFRREHHQFFGNAPADHAGAAVTAFFGQSDLCAGFASSHTCCTHAAGPTANYEKVIVEFSHKLSLRGP